ncbi:hypothetical protein QUB37_03910 [Microcoleus sp. AT3-A2]|uniref:hypothetical protein n=1 Tax=Microcoleus sp. AT3-A2 TaxID=2818610 RepID=UPI002FD09701
MPDYFHSALRGEQIHEAKIKVLPEGSIFPVPDWEGQFLVVGLKLYVSIKQNNVLTWLQPKAYNVPQLPANVVVFERGYGMPEPRSMYESGVIYTNIQSNDNYYLSQGQWLKLGPELSANKLLIENSNDNEGHNTPTDGTINAALLRTWELNKKYYFKFEAPSTISLSQYATSDYFVELRYFNTLASQVVDGALITLDTSGLQNVNDLYKIMVYFKQIQYGNYEQWLYCNYLFDLESRLIKVQSLASVYYSG